MPITQNSTKPKILIVEDSYLTAEAVGDLVKRCGCEVAGAVGRVETGIEFVRKNVVDAAVVDIDLHGTASFPICNQLRQRDIPFVFLTGYDRSYVIPPEFQGTVRLSKPVDDREFETALSSLTPAQPAATIAAISFSMGCRRLHGCFWSRDLSRSPLRRMKCWKRRGRKSLTSTFRSVGWCRFEPVHRRASASKPGWSVTKG